MISPLDFLEGFLLSATLPGQRIATCPILLNYHDTAYSCIYCTMAISWLNFLL
ncbi:hypothetical protein BC952_2615 [Flavobacterium limicola]|uniref:Uncharacterized protein n=1 Tax=Flavobacterium limicola TaxID=180441 RepID=A0A495RZC8_9FLAO|nr:hypothetical protein BC952_2615 [Flavobacterium limicola]